MATIPASMEAYCSLHLAWLDNDICKVELQGDSSGFSSAANGELAYQWICSDVISLAIDR